MLTAIVLMLSQGQFFSQACKQYQSCNASEIFTPRVTGNSTTTAGQLLLRDSSGTATVSLDTSVGSRLCYSANCLTIDSVNATVSGPTLVVGAPGIRYVPQTSVATCASAPGRVNAFQGAASQDSYLVACDGVNAGPGVLPQFTTGTSDLFPIAYLSTRTITSGVITSGNSFLGAGPIPFSTSNTVTAGTLLIVDRMNVTCAVAGTGAGNVTVALRRVQGSAADICTATYPCATAALATVSISCNGSLTGVTGGYGSDAYGTTFSVAACATPPADCQANHAIYTR